MSACADCGTPIRPGDGAIRAWGRKFCSEDCADSWEHTVAPATTEQEQSDAR